MSTEFDMSFIEAGSNYDSGSIQLCQICDLESSISESRFDFDVYLPTYGINLQRPFVWTPEQQSAFMESIVYRRFRTIPNVSILYDGEANKRIYRVIDGKQRLTTIFNWLKGKVTLSVPGFTGTIETCPDNLRRYIGGFAIIANRAFDGRKVKIESDDMDDRDILLWFDRLNFAGTPQDQSHKEMLAKLLGKAN